MKACAVCSRIYPEHRVACSVDATPLVALADAPAPSDPDDPRIGAALADGRYLVRRRVADGGMGRVYQAYDKEDDRSVALKVLHAEVAEDEVNVERFQREYELSAELPHDHIVEVLADRKLEDGSVAIVMEYLEGEELRVKLDREKRIPPAELVRIVSQIAMGLAAPHANKLVHRDLKPENVFLCESEKYDGQVVKILDFGSVRDNSDGARKITVAGTTIGSPLYMSPEQAQGLRSLDHRADVWSVAAIAYEAITGVTAFKGGDAKEILEAVLFRDPAPPSVAGAAHGVPATLDEVVELALAKEPDVRLPSVAALADKVCAAYGLHGSHEDWAYVPVRDLEKAIAKALPETVAEHAARESAAMPEARGAEAFGEDVAMGVPEKSKLWQFVSKLVGGKG